MDSPGIVVEFILVREPSSFPKKMEDYLGCKIVEEDKREGKVEDTVKMPKAMMVEAKEGVEMEEYLFRREIDDLLKSPVVGEVNTNQALEEGEIGPIQMAT